MLSRSVNKRRALCPETVQSPTDVVDFRDHKVGRPQNENPSH